MSFKDFPIPEHFPSFPHHSDIKTYLDSYADAFGLLDNIEFNNGVAHAAQRADGRWDITDQKGETREFDLLIVGNGHHWDARYPDFPGEFTGETIHSHHYIDPQTPLDLTGKRILVVGIGNSAADITVELSSKTLQNTVTLSTRSSAWIVPKYIAGRPGDTIWRTSPYLPLSWQRKAIQLMAPPWASTPSSTGCPRRITNCSKHIRRSRWNCRCGWAPVTSSPNPTSRASTATRCTSRTAPARCSTPSSTPPATTSPSRSSTRLHQCTGQRHPPVQADVVPGMDNLVFIGFAQAVPTLFPFIECQAKLMAAYAVGRYALPPVAEMERVIDADQKKYVGHCVDRPRHTQQVDYFHYEHDIRTREFPAGVKRAELRRRRAKETV